MKRSIEEDAFGKDGDEEGDMNEGTAKYLRQIQFRLFTKKLEIISQLLDQSNG